MSSWMLIDVITYQDFRLLDFVVHLNLNDGKYY